MLQNNNEQTFVSQSGFSERGSPLAGGMGRDGADGMALLQTACWQTIAESLWDAEGSDRPRSR